MSNDDKVTVVLSVNWLEIFTALIFTKKMRYYDNTYKIPIPPMTTITILSTVDPDIISLVSEERYVVDTDGALTITVWVDDEKRGYNQSVMQQTYATPTDWFKLGALTPIEKYMKVEIKNNTSNLVNIWVTTRYGRLPKKTFEAIIKAHFEEITKAIESVGVKS